MSDIEFATSVGMDALRLCLGQPPRQHSVEIVKAWLDAMAQATLVSTASNNDTTFKEHRNEAAHRA